MADEQVLARHKAEADVLGHMLTGIMIHSDLVKLYTLIDMPKMADIHTRQVEEENSYFDMLNRWLIKQEGVIIEPVNARRIQVTAKPVTTKPDTYTECAFLNQHMIEVWHKWETGTKDMYEKMVKDYPDMKVWKKLLGAVTRELWKIERIRKKYFEV